MRNISVGSKDALVKAISIFNQGRTIKLEVNYNWNIKNSEINFNLDFFSKRVKTEEELDKLEEEFKDARKIIWYFEDKKIILDNEWQEVTSLEELNKKTDEWYKTLKNIIKELY